MISHALPRIRVGYLTDFAPTVEAYMMTYLAAYNGAALSTRCLDAYQRAWGMSDITLFPRIAGNRPAFAMVRYMGAGPNKVIIAMEGTTSPNQLWNLPDGHIGTASVVPLSGRVWGIAGEYAFAIRQILTVNDAFNAAIAIPGCNVTFTGFSLGAAIAEIMAFQHKNQFPTHQVHVQKFACPRVGTHNWVVNQNPRVHVKSTYYHIDPVQEFPNVTCRIAGFGIGGSILPQNDNYRKNANMQVIKPDGELSDGHSDGYRGNPMLAAAAFYRDHAEPNPWFYHDRHQYRYALQNMSHPDHLAYRLGYLEHNDENTWQSMFRRGGGVRPEMLALGAPAPDNTRPASEEIWRLIRGEQLPPVVAAQTPVAQYQPDTHSAWSASGDWDVYNPRRTRRRIPLPVLP